MFQADIWDLDFDLRVLQLREVVPRYRLFEYCGTICDDYFSSCSETLSLKLYVPSQW
jgi:hypothetical protein